MINVSQDYLDNIYNDETKTYCTASFGVYDLNAKNQATATATSQKYGIGGFKYFTSSIAPTTWNELTQNLKYDYTNYYGKWVVEGDRAIATLPVSNAVDGNNNTYWRTGFANDTSTSTLLYTPPFPIRPNVITIRCRSYEDTNIYYSIYGYNVKTNTWEIAIKNPPLFGQHENEFKMTNTTTTYTHIYSENNLYSKFRLNINSYSYAGQGGSAFVYNFEITSGQYQTMDPQDTIDGVIGEATNGWTSAEISNGSGTFSTNPVITYEWGELHSSAGLQLYFTDKVKQATITYYDGATVIDTYNLSGNADYYEITNAVNDYDKITIEFIEVEPNKPVELQEVNFGIEYIWEKEIISIEVEELLDNKLQELPSGKATIMLNNTQDEFNKYDPSSVMQYLQEGQRVQITNTALINGTPESVPLGVFYLASWGNSTQYTVKLEFTDLMVRLANRQYKRSDLYSNATAETVIKDLLDDYNLSYDNDVQYEIDPVVAVKTLSGYLEVQDSRSALQQICIALCAVAYSNRDGKIVVKDITNQSPLETIDYTKKQFSLGDKKEIYDSATVSRITTRSYADEEQTLFNDRVYGNNALITFNEPCARVTLTGTYVSADIHVNGVDITGANNNNITIKGSPLHQNKQTLTIVGTAVTGVTATDIEVPDIPLINTDAQAEAVGTWILAQSNKNIRDEFKWLGNPAIEIGDAVSIQEGESYLTGLIVKNKFTYNGALMETSTVVI